MSKRNILKLLSKNTWIIRCLSKSTYIKLLEFFTLYHIIYIKNNNILFYSAGYSLRRGNIYFENLNITDHETDGKT